MKSPLLALLSLAPLACAGTQPTPVAPPAATAAPVVVDLTPPAPPPAAASKPRPEPKPEAAAKPAADADPDKEGAQFGMIGILKADDPNAPTAPWGRDDALAAKGNMWGEAIGDSFGAGGLGLSGVGPGGGGKGEGIGLGSIGSLGHGAGTGTGQGFGSGHGRLGGSRRGKPPQVRMGATTVTGRLPPEVVQRIVRQNFGRFRLCYENGLRNNEKLAGKVTVKFEIGKDGAVSSVGAGETTMPDKGVVACVVRSFHGLSFPQPEGGKVSVVYPITFSPGDPAPPPDSGTSTTTGTATAPAPPAKKP